MPSSYVVLKGKILSFKSHSIVLCATCKQKHPVLSILLQFWLLSLVMWVL